MTELTLTPASIWRKQTERNAQGYIVPCPSGRVVQLQPVQLDVLIMSGKLPDILTPVAARALWTDATGDDIADKVEVAKGFIDLVDTITTAALMYPVIKEFPIADDEIALSDIGFMDKIHIFRLATGPAETLSTFSDYQKTGLATIPDGENDGEPPV